MDTTVDVISAREAWDMAQLRADGGFDIGSTGPRGSGVSVIVLDSGIDATHPDMNYAPQSVNNPNTPGLEDKVIYNAKLDQGTGVGTPGFAWIPLQNTDTTSGHGTLRWHGRRKWRRKWGPICWSCSRCLAHWSFHG